MPKNTKLQIASITVISALTCQGALTMNIFEDGGGLNVVFSGSLNHGPVTSSGDGPTGGYLDFDAFNGTTGFVGFFNRPGVSADLYDPTGSGGSVVNTVNTGFGSPSSTSGAWQLLSGSTWADDYDGYTFFFTTNGSYGPGDSIDAHMFLPGGTLASGNFNNGSSFVRTIDYSANGGGIDTFTVEVSPVSAIPEPSTYLLGATGIGLAGMVFLRRRKVKQAIAATGSTAS